jgi:lipopolysaccharide biosynthesis regulator YciM
VCLAALAPDLSAAQAQAPAAPAQQAAPAQKMPQAKSPAEGQAFQAIFQAPTPDGRIKAAEDLLTKYADTEFKAIALQIIAASYQQKNDFTNTVIYAERLLQADPQSYIGMLMVATSLAQTTREFDLDREEKLAKVEKYAAAALEALKTAPKPNPTLSDQQWEETKKDFAAQVYEARALAALVRKNNDVAIAEFKKSIEMASFQDPTTKVRLANAYTRAGQYDNAVALLDEVLKAPDLHPQIKSVAQAERARALQAKSGGAKPEAPAAPAAPATPAQPAVKKQ